jgi:hypothetical protein
MPYFGPVGHRAPSLAVFCEDERQAPKHGLGHDDIGRLDAPMKDRFVRFSRKLTLLGRARRDFASVRTLSGCERGSRLSDA